MSLRNLYILKLPIAIFLLFITLASQIPTVESATNPVCGKYQQPSLIAGITPGHAVCLHGRSGDNIQAFTFAEKNTFIAVAVLCSNLSPRDKQELYFASYLLCDKPVNSLTSQLLI